MVPPRVPPRDLYRPIQQPAPDYSDTYYWKPSNVELERSRLLETRSNKFLTTTTAAPLSLDRREAELVFRFDPHASAEYLSSQYKAPSDQYQYSVPATPANGFSRITEPDGPFVFGVHTPSQFPLPNRRDEEDYDYSEVAEENGHTTVPDDISRDLNCCDRVNEWTVSDKKKATVFNRMFHVKDKRKVKGGRKEKIKCVLVGDGAVGKSSLIAAYAQDAFKEDYQPTAFDTFNGEYLY